MPKHKVRQFTTSLYLILSALTFMSCKKADVSPITPTKAVITEIVTEKAATAVSTTTKADSVKIINNDATDTSNPEYWYNGTKGTALIFVNCKDCNAIAKIGDNAIPFMINDKGVGVLRYTPKAGLSIYIAVCPGSTKAINVDISDANNVSLFKYSGIITANWLNTFLIK